MTATEKLKRTPLYATHVESGAKMVGFGGWEMPVQYTSIIEEHLAVRQRVGLFDISHMGEVLVAGPNAERVLNHLLTNDVRHLAVSQAQYTLLGNDEGGIIDDLIVYRVEPTVYLLVINASHIERDFNWMTTHAWVSTPRHTDVGCVFENRSDQTAALALQGPAAARCLPEAAGSPRGEAEGLKRFHIQRLRVNGKDCRVTRTGYTGEDGFELLCAPADAGALWTELLARGREFGIQPCGLGARDTLRLEMCYPLHGNDITDTTTPLEACLDKYVAFDKGDFIGRAALEEQRAKGVTRKLVAFRMTGKCPPPRQHYPILAGGQRTGEITSGTQSPSLGVGIGMGYVAVTVATPGTKIEVEIRGNKYPAIIEKPPLLKK
ncbi:MAG: glycine cleavage system aminomethyltransferase GcvT [Verrucomicrobiia bacterium]